VFEEIKRVLNTNQAHVFFNKMQWYGFLDVFFPELNKLVALEQAGHRETAWRHTVWVLEEGAYLTPEEKFALLLHDVGKGETPEEIRPHHYGHEETGVAIIEEICKRYQVPTEYKRLACNFAREHMRMHRIEVMTPSKLIKLAENRDIQKFKRMAACDTLGRQPPDYKTSFTRLEKAQTALNKISWEQVLDLTNSNLKDRVRQIKIETVKKALDV
jgi:tRNA nucleotidyltransferase (CCA-adding enzyme)